MFGPSRAELDREIMKLRDRVRQLETFTAPRAEAAAKELAQMNRTDYGYDTVLSRLRRIEDALRALKQEIADTDDKRVKKIDMVHHLVNNLATILGFKRNIHTSASVCPDMWVNEEVDPKLPMVTVLEPTGRLHKSKNVGGAK